MNPRRTFTVAPDSRRVVVVRDARKYLVLPDRRVLVTEPGDVADETQPARP